MLKYQSMLLSQRMRAARICPIDHRMLRHVTTGPNVATICLRQFGLYRPYYAMWWRFGLSAMERCAKLQKQQAFRFRQPKRDSFARNRDFG